MAFSPLFTEQKAAGCLLRSKQNGVPMNTAGLQLNGNSHPVLRSNLSPWAGPSSVHRPTPGPSSRSRSSSTNHASDLHQLYQQLYEVFGDSLVPRIAFNNWQDGAVTKSKLLRIQPLTHKYFPLRPLHREMKTIKDLIDKAKDQRNEGKQPVDDEAKEGRVSPTKVPEGQKQTRKARVAPFVVTSCSKKVVRTSLQDAVFESRDAPSADGTNRRRSRSRSHREINEAMDVEGHASEEVNPSFDARSKIKTGKIKRRFKRAWPFLAHASKYDYHVGVTL